MRQYSTLYYNTIFICTLFSFFNTDGIICICTFLSFCYFSVTLCFEQRAIFVWVCCVDHERIRIPKLNQVIVFCSLASVCYRYRIQEVPLFTLCLSAAARRRIVRSAVCARWSAECAGERLAERPRRVPQRRRAYHSRTPHVERGARRRALGPHRLRLRQTVRSYICTFSGSSRMKLTSVTECKSSGKT